MKIIIALALLLVSSAIAYGECTTEMQAFNNHQNVIKGMMDMNFEGKLNSENSKAIGEHMKKGQEASNEGDYAKACEIYDSIIADYGFEKAFGLQNEGSSEETPSKEKDAEASSISTSSAAASPDGE